jgi:hypothetical protein
MVSGVGNENTFKVRTKVWLSRFLFGSISTGNPLDLAVATIQQL